MTKLIIPFLLVLGASGCKNNNTENTNNGAAKPEYAYTISKPDNWDIGSSQNTALVLSSLKAFEENKIDESISFFADSVNWRADFYDRKLSKDTLKALITSWRNDVAAITIKMHDFVSNISKDKKDEWVTAWYTQVFTDKTGKIDSIAVINDFKLMNGKIVELNETVRHFPTK